MSPVAQHPDFHLPPVYLEGQHIRWLDRLVRSPEVGRADDSSGDSPHPGLLADYQDPVGKLPDGAAYAGRWLAAAEPVVVSGRPPQSRDSGWGVIVQQRYGAATAPVRDLGNQLVRKGLSALGVVFAVITALWAFVILALTESSMARVVRSLRRGIGLPTPSSLATPSDPSRRP
jgi:hypothetical protein